MAKEKSLMGEMRCLSHMIKRMIDRSGSKKYVDKVTGTNGFIISYIAKNEGRDVFQKDLEQEFSIRRSTASSIVALMEKKGLIERRGVDYDARLKKLSLTEKGWEIRKIMTDDIKRIDMRLKESFEKDELDKFFEYIDRLKSAVDKIDKSENQL